MQEAAKMAALQAEYEYKSKLVVLESEKKIASQQAKLNVCGNSWNRKRKIEIE